MDLDRLLDVFAILFGVGGIGSFLLSVKRSRAQNALDLSSAWEKFAAPLMERLECLEDKVKEQDDEINDLRGWAERLAKQVIELGGVPLPFVRRARQTEEAKRK
jgi:hypothetical protein